MEDRLMGNYIIMIYEDKNITFKSIECITKNRYMNDVFAGPEGFSTIKRRGKQNHTLSHLTSSQGAQLLKLQALLIFFRLDTLTTDRHVFIGLTVFFPYLYHSFIQVLGMCSYIL